MFIPLIINVIIHILSNIYLNASKSEKSKMNELDYMKIFVKIFYFLFFICWDRDENNNLLEFLKNILYI